MEEKFRELENTIKALKEKNEIIPQATAKTKTITIDIINSLSI